MKRKCKLNVMEICNANDKSLRQHSKKYLFEVKDFSLPDLKNNPWDKVSFAFLLQILHRFRRRGGTKNVSLVPLSCTSGSLENIALYIGYSATISTRLS